jgi:hypothetical protein
MISPINLGVGNRAAMNPSIAVPIPPCSRTVVSLRGFRCSLKVSATLLREQVRVDWLERMLGLFGSRRCEMFAEVFRGEFAIDPLVFVPVGAM